MEQGALLEFLRKKDFKFLKFVGRGATGKTILLDDETIHVSFICKKYAPGNEEDRDLYFEYFVNEVKLLHLLYHKNVVRIFNHYLYPEKKTGFILMEYVEGFNIDVYLKSNPDRLNDIFIQTISGFSHLEEIGILHRDIRPENILVSADGTVKIIDLGFGKKIIPSPALQNSISLAWRYPVPNEFESKNYDFQSEIFFVGKLFQEIKMENEIDGFLYENVLTSMTRLDPANRIVSFHDVSRKVLEKDFLNTDFSAGDKRAYQDFAGSLQAIITKIETQSTYRSDVLRIERSLEELLNNSVLEDYVQNHQVLTQIFVAGKYYYKTTQDVLTTKSLKDFLQFLRSSSQRQKKIIINNLWNRLDSIKRYEEVNTDDLPF